MTLDWCFDNLAVGRNAAEEEKAVIAEWKKRGWIITVLIWKIDKNQFLSAPQVL